jgi:hypothetical protein
MALAPPRPIPNPSMNRFRISAGSRIIFDMPG